MPLSKPPIKDRTEILADWVELRTLADRSGRFSLARLKRYWDTHRETEDSDVEGRRNSEENTDEDGVSGEDADLFIDAIIQELGERARILKTCYPFEFNQTGNSINTKQNLDIGSCTYIFCLLFEHHKKGDIWNGEWLPPIDNKIRDLFQVCSTYAAAGDLRGSSISFGWPRPTENPPFLQKLKEVYNKFGEGKPVSVPKPGASPYVKDEGIDIIAWRPRQDESPGTQYLLGQVASGDDWVDKSVKACIEYFHRTWFDEIPASSATAAMFIPHAVPPCGDGDRRDRMNLLIAKFGNIYDRMFLPSMAEAGYRFGMEKRADIVIERLDEHDTIKNWVSEQIESIRRVGGAPL